MSVASLQNLTVRYGQRTAVSDLTVAFPEGCVGLLGPNGAGKSTLIKTLLGFLRPASGTGEVLGLDVAREGARIRQRTGLMPEADCHIPGMNAVSFVSYAGELSGMPPAQALRRAHEVLEYCGLGEARYRDVETYSLGMRQRIKLAQAIVHGPSLVFLDEPTNGLDPEGRDQLLLLIRDISHGKGVNVVVSSHLLRDIERTCDAVVVMKGGAVVVSGEIAVLKGVSGGQVDLELREPSGAFVQLAEQRGARILHAAGARYRLALPDTLVSTARSDGLAEFEGLDVEPGETPGRFLFGIARAAGAQLRGFRTAERSLEDVFLEALE